MRLVPQLRPHVVTNERNRCDRKDIFWAFVFGARNEHIWTPESSFLCSHNSNRSLYNYFLISVHFFPRTASHFLGHHDSTSNLKSGRVPVPSVGSFLAQEYVLFREPLRYMSHQNSTFALFTSLSTLTLFTSHLLSSFFCCCWGAHLRSRSFHYHNHLFPLLVVVL